MEMRETPTGGMDSAELDQAVAEMVSDRLQRVYSTLAYIAVKTQGTTGTALRHALYAALLSAETGVCPRSADEIAKHPAWDLPMSDLMESAVSHIARARRESEMDDHACRDCATYEGTYQEFIRKF